MTAQTNELHTVEGDTVEFSRDYQGVTLWLGDGLPVHISDETADIDILDLIQSPGQRAVTLTRLRRIAEVLATG